MADFAKYKPGLEMLAYPSQQFGAQEYKTDEEVLSFATAKGFEGTVMSTGDVKGDSARESWRFFYQETDAQEPTWNFKGKFLVSKDGKVSVPGSDLEGDIQKLLNE
jgi:glutathione peroxidase-family protein